MDAMSSDTELLFSCEQLFSREDAEGRRYKAIFSHEKALKFKGDDAHVRAPIGAWRSSVGASDFLCLFVATGLSALVAARRARPSVAVQLAWLAAEYYVRTKSWPSSERDLEVEGQRVAKSMTPVLFVSPLWLEFDETPAAFTIRYRVGAGVSAVEAAVTLQPRDTVLEIVQTRQESVMSR